MSAAVLRLCVLLGLQLGRAAEPRARTVLEELLPLTDPLRPAAAAAPHRKAPQFMLELFDAVSAGNRRSQKEVLDGNVVRSFEDKGEHQTGVRMSAVRLRRSQITHAGLRAFPQIRVFSRSSSNPHFVLQVVKRETFTSSTCRPSAERRR